MSKGLKELNNLVNHINLLNHINGVTSQEVFEPLVNKYKSIIEKELKRLEELEKAFKALSKEDEKTKKLLSLEIEKNRALEIIKKKVIVIPFLILHLSLNDLKGYNKAMDKKHKLTQDEFDFLKKVML